MSTPEEAVCTNCGFVANDSTMAFDEESTEVPDCSACGSNDWEF